MRAEKVSIENAKPDKLFYVVTGATVYRRSDGRCLIMKRSEREIVHPGKWANTGGKLEHRDLDMNSPTSTDGDVAVFDNALAKLLIREVKEESGVAVKPEPKFIGSRVFVRPDGIPVVLLKFGVEYASGEVKPEEGAFTDFAWVNTGEVDSYNCIDGVADEVRATIKLFENEPAD
ncbi:MAG TPA: NUDIX domain-containing protein [Candidatus Saccharimonadales bacterium]|nr:NUDIX domain-containing protein [Candidatus Saccharimonadales bacterium]